MVKETGGSYWPFSAARVGKHVIRRSWNNPTYIDVKQINKKKACFRSCSRFVPCYY